MPYVNTDVWVDDLELEDADDEELIEELRRRGFEVSTPRDKFNIESLYNIYTTMPPEFFEKELKKYFNENLNVYVR